MPRFPDRYPKDLLNEVTRRLTALKRMSERMNAELAILDRYTTVAQLQREDLEERIEDMREDMKQLKQQLGKQEADPSTLLREKEIQDA